MKKLIAGAGLVGLLLFGKPAQSQEPVKIIDNYNTNISSYTVNGSTDTFDVAKSTDTLENLEVETPKKKDLLKIKTKKLIVPKKKNALVNILKRFEIGVGVELNLCDPMEAFYADMNQRWKDGDYTFGAKVDDYVDMKSPKNLTLTGIEGSFNIINKDNFKVKLNLARATGSAAAEHYEESAYVPEGPEGIIIKRNENYNLEKTSIGIGLEKEIKRFILGLNINLDQYKINGIQDLEWTTPAYNYTQWRDSTFSKNGRGISAKIKAGYKLFKNIVIEGVLGYNSANIQTIGTEIREGSTTPGSFREYEYNPLISFNNIKTKANIKIKF